MNFKSIISSCPPSTFMVIQDENSVRGLNILKGILKIDADDDTVKEIHLVCFENYTNSFSGLSEKIIKHDLHKDPCCWLQETGCDLSSTFSKIFHTQNKNATVFIDSMNAIILLSNIDHACNIIIKLKEGFKKIVCLLHGDIVGDETVLKKINFFSNIYVKLHLNIPKEVQRIDTKYVGIDGIYKKPSGKIIILREMLLICSNYNIQSKLFNSKRKETCISDISQEMKNLTTFRLGLDIKENERIARDNLVLPYLRSACGNQDSKAGTGNIIYFTEASDDLEDDPDDDLDI